MSCCRSELPGELSCGLTLRRGRGAFTVASSGSRASQVDEIQYGHDEGPCLHSLATGQVVVVDDLASDERCGDYQMPTLGPRGPLSLPLHADGQVIGAPEHPRYPAASLRADQAAGRRSVRRRGVPCVALAVRIAERTEMSEHLQQALLSRAVIDQVLGIIMGQNRCARPSRRLGLTPVDGRVAVPVRDIWLV